MLTSSHNGNGDALTFTHTKVGTIAWATLVAGVLDAVAAIVVYYAFYGFNPIQIYQFVASGLLGTDAYSNPVFSLLGVIVHFLVAFVAALTFYLAYPALSFLSSNRITSGLIYGAVVWGVMNFIIIPLSLIPPAPFDAVTLISLLWHLLLVGLPISLITHKYYQSQKLS